jgi:hypothetical protein
MPETPIRFRPVLQFFAALVRITVQDLGHAPFEPLRSLRIVAPPKVRRQPMQLIGRDEEDGMQCGAPATHGGGPNRKPLKGLGRHGASSATAIDELERQSCEEIFFAREREYQDSYRHMPALDELAARYGVSAR